MTRCLVLLTTTFIVTSLPQPVAADIVFEQSSNNLIVNITAPVDFVATANYSSDRFFVVFPDVYSSPVPGTASVTPTTLTSTLTIDTASTDYAVWGHGVPPSNYAFDSTDFFAGFLFPSTPLQSLTIGETATLSPGVVTLTNFFSDADARMPDLAVTFAKLADSSAFADLSGLVSVPTSVPEPSAFAFMSLVGLGVCAVAWLKKQRAK